MSQVTLVVIEFSSVRLSPARRPETRRWSLARQLLWVQLSGFVVLVAVGSGLAYLDAARAVNDRAHASTLVVL